MNAADAYKPQLRGAALSPVGQTAEASAGVR